MVDALLDALEAAEEFFGFPGTRTEAIEKLVECFRCTETSYCIVTGVYRIGKTQAIKRAVKLVKQEGVEAVVWPNDRYEALSLGGLVNVIQQNTEGRPFRWGPKSGIPEKDHKRVADWIEERLRGKIANMLNGCIILALAVNRYGRTHDYISHNTFGTPASSKNVRYKIILEERVHRREPDWQVGPARRPIVRVCAFSGDEAFDFAVRTLAIQSGLREVVGEDQQELFVLGKVLSECASRHPYLLEQMCKYASIAVREWETGWRKTWGIEDGSVRERILKDLGLLAEGPLRGVMAQIMRDLPREVRICLRDIVDGRTSDGDARGEIAILKTYGLLKENGSCPEVVVWLLRRKGRDKRKGSRATEESMSGIGSSSGAEELRDQVRALITKYWASAGKARDVDEVAKLFEETKGLLETARVENLKIVYGILARFDGETIEKITVVLETLKGVRSC